MICPFLQFFCQSVVPISPAHKQTIIIQHPIIIAASLTVMNAITFGESPVDTSTTRGAPTMSDTALPPATISASAPIVSPSSSVASAESSFPSDKTSVASADEKGLSRLGITPFVLLALFCAAFVFFARFTIQARQQKEREEAEKRRAQELAYTTNAPRPPNLYD